MSLKYRRIIFASLFIITLTGLSAILTYSLSLGGFNLAEFVFISCLIVTLPWTIIGFWNALLGFALLRFAKNPSAHVFPLLRGLNYNEEITTKTALLVCVRNEEVELVYRNVNAMIARLVASGSQKQFHIYILSDSFAPEIIAQEKACIAKLKKQWQEKIDITYRLRADNAGFKAGNIKDFCERWGKNYDFMITLDADSVMSAASILRLVRLMQQNDNLGIVQSLAVGLPSDSAFARTFQYGMRMGMKSFTLGSAWWQGDCGPYWGHNAILRVKPFMEHCYLEKIPGNGPLSGWILSHDQVEAVYMRSAGYECRVIVDENGSYEENPPHILEFIRRDLRWCHGNMQYLKLLTKPGLLFMSRLQLVLAILMFINAPAWIGLVLTGTIAFTFPQVSALEGREVMMPYFLFTIIMSMVFAPKILSWLDLLFSKEERKSYGGIFTIIISAISELLFSMLLAPIVAISQTIFLIGLFVFKRAKGWTQQSRKLQSLPLGTMIKHFWPHTLIGAMGLTIFANMENISLLWMAFASPFFIGAAVSIPFGITSSNLKLGGLMARIGLWQIPEENKPPVIMRGLNLPAVIWRVEAEKSAEQYGPLNTQQLLQMEFEPYGQK